LEEIPEQDQPLWRRKLATVPTDVPFGKIVIPDGGNFECFPSSKCSSREFLE